MIKKCIYCNKKFETNRKNAKFCSYKCYWRWLSKYQKEHSKEISKRVREAQARPEVREKMRKAKLGKPRAGNPENWKHSEETKKKLSEALKGRHLSPKTEFKKGHIPWCKGTKGIMKPNSGSFKKGQIPWNFRGKHSSKRQQIKNSKEWKEWRCEVFKRDNFTCQKCGDNRGGNLQPHHILNFAEHPELRFDIDNGITLCEKCHKEFHNRYGYKHNNREQLNKFLYEDEFKEGKRK